MGAPAHTNISGKDAVSRSAAASERSLRKGVAPMVKDTE